MKDKKTIIICLSVIAVLCGAFVVCAVIAGHGRDTAETVDEPITEVGEIQPDNIVVEKPSATEKSNTEVTATKAKDIADTGTALTPNAESSGSVTVGKTDGGTASETVSPVKESTPTESGGEAKPKEYKPETGSETVAYIKNLELDGCPYCGRHDCPSFYALDEWGNPCYTPIKCPSYDIHKDPVHYCQECGKPTGDGANGTCVQFVESCSCPLCGEWVTAWTCHSCEE
jgi:hypothetical protein